MIKNLFIIIFFILGCAENPKPLPDWILHTKNDPQIWSSVGLGPNREIATQQAINSIASQISVQIESKIKFIKTEHNFEIDQFSKSIIESRVNISLPEVQINEVIKINNTWYARASLNKNYYFKLLEDKRQNAKITAINFLREAKNLNKREALQTIFKAYEEIETFLDYPIYVNYNGNPNSNLYSEIISQFTECIQGIKINPEKNIYKFKPILPIRKKIPINISTTDNQSSDGLPFVINFDSGKTNKKMIALNNSMQILIDEIYPNSISGEISIQLDTPAILNKINIPRQFKIQPSTRITIEILPLQFYIQSEEMNFDKKLDSKKIYPIVSQYIIDNYSGLISDSKEESDLHINLKLKTYKGNNGNNEWGIFKSYADFNMQVIMKDTNQEIFNFSINPVQGGDFQSHKNAGSQAINNLATQLKNEILPLFNASLIQN